ncbi:MAG: L,D-transpeptidase [Deltaproteobacteria bacterium]|nr:L,D-transpeptidase [Deltaproteobacteria bacterium]
MRATIVLAIAAVPMIASVLAPLGCKRDQATAAAPSASASGSAVEPAGVASLVAPAPSLASAVPSGPVLASIQMQTFIYAEPRRSSTRLGYLRAGAIVGRSENPASKDGCPGGWYGIKPLGYVCVGEQATTDPEHPIVKVTSHRRPDITKPMPYRYGFIRAVAPQYLKVPTKEEQLQYEFKLLPHLAYYGKHEAEINAVWPGANEVADADREAPLLKPQVSPDAAPPKVHKKKASTSSDDGEEDDEQQLAHEEGGEGAAPSTALSVLELFGADTAHEKAPWWLQGPQRGVPHLSTFVAPKGAVIAGRVRRHTGLALIDAFETGPESMDRKFAVTTDLRLVPISKLKPNVGSPWHGLALDDKLTLPIAFSYAPDAKKDAKARKPIKVYTGLESGSAKESGAALFFRQAVALTGKDKTVGDTRYFEFKDASGAGGKWLRKQDIIIARKPDEWPAAFAKGTQKWIDISIIKQTLTLYEGEKPVFVTLISTGQDGMGDPKTTKSTPRGTFRMRDKHVTATMDANEVGNKFELRDVPWVQYFEAGYALHAAYWHDVYGTARSHGCVNLSPIDARKVFLWTDPPVPAGWHGVTAADSSGKGTIVYIHV